MYMNIPENIFEGWHILVVEDDKHSVDVVRRILEHYKATIHTAENGSRALTAIEELPPNFILADLSMPVMDGWEMLRRIKADPTKAHIPVIALTAHAMIGDREKAIESGCSGYLTKPLRPRTFIFDLVQILLEIPDFGFELQ